MRLDEQILGDFNVRQLLGAARSIWGPRPVDGTSRLPEVVVRLMVGVGDLSRIAREFGSCTWEVKGAFELGDRVKARHEIKKELGNIIFSTIRWCDDLGFDVGECLHLAVETQRSFVQSGRPW